MAGLVYVRYTMEKWIDDVPEMKAKIPPKEELIDKIPINCHNPILTIIIISALAYDWKIKPLMNWQTKILYYAILIALAFWDGYRQKKQKGYIEIYPEMFVVYFYDKEQKKIRPSGYFYWSGIVQYSRKENAIWFKSIDNFPYCPSFKMKKMRPYLEQYAPNAKVVDFDIGEYWDKKALRELAEEKAEEKKAENARMEAEMAANREKAQQLLENANDVSDTLAQIEKNNQEASADAIQKAKDKAKDWFDKI